MAIKPKTKVRVRVDGHCASHCLTELRTRGHSFVIDEPPERGGTDVAPTPLETMLGALIGCTNVIASRIAEEMGIALRLRRIRVEAELDHRGIDGLADVSVPFPEIILQIEAETDLDESELAPLRDALDVRCPMSVILRQSGSSIRQDWALSPLSLKTGG
ncbi:putative OsmC-like protein [Roseinatronobacter thiooxidans]|uniref:Putative OsmC-like protein n=1 Tax=Roseinatronobacter thiooxidans TaxID=121821 RepID=A0A2W7PSV6_9RHOB|nr:OsmC family protein [Roseinatronobacter thiooxidans]PZX36760.1 putative OsmC-like protein [Roseinatronobacter thiooxidans]